MSLARQTVRGAIWTISASFGSRLFGLVATLIVTRFVVPADYGEVMVAVVLVLSANQFSTLGVGQYVIAHPSADRRAVFHATLYFVLIGVAALYAVFWLAGRLGPLLGAPQVMRYVPGLVLSAAIDRIGFMPERVLVRDLRFGVASAGRTLGELSYSVGAIVLAAFGWGAMAIVGGNVLRSLARSIVFVAAVDLRDWLRPCRLEAGRSRELLAFGLPLSVAGAANFASRRWDNLLVSHYFGAGATGMYNLAYNLADVPAIQIGEQVGEVLLPSFARLGPERRERALESSIRLLGLVVFPLAVGLGVVAPTLVRWAFDARWQAVAPMLVILSALSVTRSVGWTVESYLQARHLPGTVMGLEIFKLAVLVVAIVILGRHSPLWTCVAVGAAFAAHTLAALAAVRRADGVPFSRLLSAVTGPLLACAPMVAAVVVARHAWAALGQVSPLPALLVEVSFGALAYVVTVLVFAPSASRELWERISDAIPRPSADRRAFAHSAQRNPKRRP